MAGIDVEAFVFHQGGLQCHVHLNGGGHDVFTFNDVKSVNPELGKAVDELEASIAGAIAIKMREALHVFSPPQSPEQALVGLCFTCKTPTSSDEPGTRVNGPLIYCKAHA